MNAGWIFLLTLTFGGLAYLAALLFYDYRASRRFWKSVEQRTKGSTR